MREFSYTVTDNEGLHARPAGLLVKQAMQYKCKVHVHSGSSQADLKRIFAVMGLCVKKGDTVKVQTEGNDEDRAAHELKELMQAYL